MMSNNESNNEETSSINTPLRRSPAITTNIPAAGLNEKNQNATKITLDQIASTLLKQNFILTALEFHTELAETGRELPRLRDFFSNPANFEQLHQTNNPSSFSSSNIYSYTGSGSGGGNGFYPLHRASSIQTFDSLDLTRYSDDVGENKCDDKIAVLEFELRKAKETINQLRNTLTLATDSNDKTPNKESNHESSNSRANSYNSESSNSNSEPIEYIEFAEIKTSSTQATLKSCENIKAVMPHEKNVINFLINEYLLTQNYKMTSVTFAEENESQDLEDWDVIGLNRAKPPNLCQIYKYFLKKSVDVENPRTTLGQATVQLDKQTSVSPKVVYEDSGVQVGVQLFLESVGTNTDAIAMQCFGSMVNFDEASIEKQRVQITKLIEKQEILVKSISSLEKEINVLDLEREANLKKIDLLSVSLDEANSLVKSMQKERGELQKKLSSEVINVGDGSEKELEKTEQKDFEPDSGLMEKRKPVLNDRKIPVVFRNYLNKYSMIELNEQNQLLRTEISQLKIEYNLNTLVEAVFKYLPIVSASVNSESRLNLLPLVLIGAVFEQNDPLISDKKEHPLLKLLFNLIESPNTEQRAMILFACVQFTKYVGPMCVNNYLLPQCWEQINHKSEERRMLVAEACAVLAPHIYTEMRSSLMFSILKEVIEQEKCEQVRVSAAKSLAILINYIKDEHKFNQCIELLDMCATDSSPQVVAHVENLMMPSLSLWALLIKKFNEPLMTHLLDKTEIYLLNKQNNYSKIYLNLLQMNLQFVFASILLHFRETKFENNNIMNANLELDYQLSKLNAYFHVLQEKINVSIDLYKLDSYLDDYLQLTKQYLLLIENDTWPTAELSNAFKWLNDNFLRKIIQMSVHVDANSSICPTIVKFFSDFVLLFTIDFELIKSEIIPIFEKLLNVPASDTDDKDQTLFENSLKNKSCPLYKATLPVYFVGILSTLVDVEINGWFDIIQDAKNGELKKSNSIQFTSPPALSQLKDEANTLVVAQKRLEYMNEYLKNVFFALSLNQTNLDGLIVIYELMKQKSNESTSSDYIIQMLISTLWDGIVHMSLYVRCNTARLFEILVKDCNDNLLSTRILPALITLANDLDKMVRCSSISPLTSIIECCSNNEILERVYTQLQSFLSDPILKEEYMLQIELLKSFRRIASKSNIKFREEFILPYLTILTLQIKNAYTDNDYEFPMSAFTVSFSQINSISSSTLASSSSSQISNKFNEHQNHQQDIIKISVLIYDTYQKLCTTQDINKVLYISRQSLQESLLPGLFCLRDIFQDHIISSISGKNEYVQHLDTVISTVERMQSTGGTPVLDSPMFKENAGLNSCNSTPGLQSKETFSPTIASVAAASLSNLPAGATSLTNHAASTVSELVNAGVTALATPITTVNTVAGYSSTAITDNANVKSMFFKGINTFKDQSKDKFSNFLLTNKGFKK